MNESILHRHLQKISSDFGLFLDRYIKGEMDHNYKMATVIKKLMLNSNFSYVGLFQNFINIADELKQNGLVIGDIDNSNNWGLKNGALAIFDIGFGQDWTHLNDIDVISENGQRDEDPAISDRMKSIAKKIGHEIIKYLGGQNYGYAYEVSGGKVLKITTDPTEAKNSLKIVNKQMKYIANIYKVYKYMIHWDIYYIILLEKLDTNGIQQAIEGYNKIDDFIFNLWKLVDKNKYN